MTREPRERDVLKARDRLLRRKPGLRRSFDKYLKDFKKYRESMDVYMVVSGCGVGKGR